MRIQSPYPSQIRFRHYRPKNFIVVENWAEQVVVRALRDNFSEQRKRLFIRHLAAEGFIPDHYESLARRRDPDLPGVEWVIELQEPTARETQPRRQRQVLTAISCAAVLWLVTMLLVFLRAS